MSALPTSKTPAALRAAGKLPDKGKGRRDAKWHHEKHRQTGKGDAAGGGAAVYGSGPEPELKGLLNPPIDVDLVKPAPVSVRYYESKRFFTDPPKKHADTVADQYVLQHSNGLCVLGLAPGHPLIAGGKEIKSVNFRAANQKNKPSGKKKIGAVWLTEYSVLCDVVCADGTEHTLYACIRANLYQINKNIVDNPSLLSTSPNNEGWIAIVAPKKEEQKRATKNLLSQEQYDLLRKARLDPPAWFAGVRGPHLPKPAHIYSPTGASYGATAMAHAAVETGADDDGPPAKRAKIEPTAPPSEGHLVQ